MLIMVHAMHDTDKGHVRHLWNVQVHDGCCVDKEDYGSLRPNMAPYGSNKIRPPERAACGDSRVLK